MIEVPAGIDAGTQIPLTVMGGVKPGPVLALIAGNHGYEYPPILALQQLRAQLDPTKVAGTILMVHVANMPSFLGRTIYFSPVDGKNLNRCYPGDPNGTVSQRIAHAVTTHVIDKADVVLDLHCGDGNEALRPYVYQTVTADRELNDRIARLALAFGIDHVILDRARPTDPAHCLYCSNAAITRGKPGMTIESGSQGGTDDESVERIVNGVLGVMRELQMIENGPAPRTTAVYLDPVADVTSPATGILYPLVDRDEHVTRGTVLARITDFFGEEIAVVEAPIDGVVLYIVATPPITKGQPIGCVGTIHRP